MELQNLQKQAQELPIRDRWRLVQMVLTSIRKDSPPSKTHNSHLDFKSSLDPWTQSLIGVIQLNSTEFNDSYIDYLEEKYS